MPLVTSLTCFANALAGVNYHAAIPTENCIYLSSDGRATNRIVEIMSHYDGKAVLE